MSDPTEEELAAAFEAWASDPDAVAQLESDLADLEAEDPALAEQGRRAEAAFWAWAATDPPEIRAWLAGADPGRSGQADTHEEIQKRINDLEERD